MHLPSGLILLSFTTAATLAAPTPQTDSITAAAAAAASRKNVYLSTCTTPYLLGIISDTSSVAIYYNGVANPRTSPTDAGTVSSTARPWEGYTRRTTLSSMAFTSRVDINAGRLGKSEIAGTGTLGDEDLVCFVDGTTTFSFSSGLLGLREQTCVADYWCASIGSS